MSLKAHGNLLCRVAALVLYYLCFLLAFAYVLHEFGFDLTPPLPLPPPPRSFFSHSLMNTLRWLSSIHQCVRVCCVAPSNTERILSNELLILIDVSLFSSDMVYLFFIQKAIMMCCCSRSYRRNKNHNVRVVRSVSQNQIRAKATAVVPSKQQSSQQLLLFPPFEILLRLGHKLQLRRPRTRPLQRLLSHCLLLLRFFSLCCCIILVGVSLSSSFHVYSLDHQPPTTNNN